MKRMIVQVISDSLEEDDVFVIEHPSDLASAVSAIDEIAGWLVSEGILEEEDGVSLTLGEVMSAAIDEKSVDRVKTALGISVSLLELDLIEGYNSEIARDAIC
jgi:hypothetical protein